MSKDKPEVGDVWAMDYCQYHIIRIQKLNNKDIYVQVLNLNLIKEVHTLDYFTKYFKYLGKSKTNISNLFKTENE